MKFYDKEDKEWVLVESSRQIPVLSMRVLRGIKGFTGTTDGQALVARFCNGVLHGGILKDADVRAIANALLPILNPKFETNQQRMQQVAKKLKVTDKQGQRRKAEMSEKNYIERVVYYINQFELLKNSGEDESTAMMKARKMMMDYYGIGDRAARNTIDKYSYIAQKFIEPYKPL